MLVRRSEVNHVMRNSCRWASQNWFRTGTRSERWRDDRREVFPRARYDCRVSSEYFLSERTWLTVRESVTTEKARDFTPSPL